MVLNFLMGRNYINQFDFCFLLFCIIYDGNELQTEWKYFKPKTNLSNHGYRFFLKTINNIIFSHTKGRVIIFIFPNRNLKEKLSKILRFWEKIIFFNFFLLPLAYIFRNKLQDLCCVCESCILFWDDLPHSVRSHSYSETERQI